MASHVCPWWFAYTFDHPLRRWLYKPEVAFRPYVEPGMTVMDVGCGMGFNAIGLARLVGDEGRVLAVDLQARILDVLRRRAARAGLAHRIRTLQCKPDWLAVDVRIDFAVAFWVVHEVTDARQFLVQVCSVLRPGGRFFVAEPRFHVSRSAFRHMVDTAQTVGLHPVDQPRIRASRVVVLVNA